MTNKMKFVQEIAANPSNRVGSIKVEEDPIDPKFKLQDVPEELVGLFEGFKQAVEEFNQVEDGGYENFIPVRCTLPPTTTDEGKIY